LAAAQQQFGVPEDTEIGAPQRNRPPRKAAKKN
jgi:hypothetical protein